jgi:hypothetical protein
MSLLERRFDDAGSSAAVAGRIGENVAGDAGVGEASAARRIRLGLTGLAAIFLIVLIAAAGLRPTALPAAADSQAEPLAVLGVAPGAAPAAEEGLMQQAKAPPSPNRPSPT